MSDLSSDLLIVIPCLNEEAHLSGLLSQVTSENPDVLIVVADGGSTDRSCAIIADFALHNPRCILLHNAKRIQSSGINYAVETYGSGCKWLLRLDAHCDYPSDYAIGLMASAREKQATSVVVPMVSRGVGCFQRAAAAAQNSVLGTGGSPHRHVGTGRFVDHGHHALMRLDLFRQVGGYREDMSHNEDAELDLRLLAAGGRIWLEPSLALTYYPRATMRGLWRQYLGFGRGRARTLKLHRRPPKFRQLAPLAVPPAIVAALFFPVTLWLAAPLAIWAGSALISGFVIGLRAGGGCAMFSGVAAMISHCAWASGFMGEWSKHWLGTYR